MQFETLEILHCGVVVLYNDIEIEIWDIELHQYVLDEHLPFYPDAETYYDFVEEYIRNNRDVLISYYLEDHYAD